MKSGTASIKLPVLPIKGEMATFNPATIAVGEIIPVPYKEGKIIKNVALNRVGENGENVIRKNGAKIEGEEDFREALNGRGKMNLLTDGLLYGGVKNSTQFAPMIEVHPATNVAGMELYTLDLGKAYDIAGVAFSGTESIHLVSNQYIIEVNNSQDLTTTDVKDDITYTVITNENADIKYTDIIGHNGKNDETFTVYPNQVASNFSMNETSRYVHVGTANGYIRADISELMVFAYVGTEPEVVEPEISISLVALNPTENENEYAVEVAVNSNVDIADAKCIIAIKTRDGKLLSADIVPVTDAVAGILTGYVTITESEIEEGVVTEGYLWKPDQSPYINKTPLEM